MFAIPGLHIDDYGDIGLPLSVREAAALKDWVVGGTDVVRVDGNGWDFHPSKVRVSLASQYSNKIKSCQLQVQFNNLRWSEFLEELVQHACDALGVDPKSNKPRYELRTLRLLARGSRCV